VRSQVRNILFLSFLFLMLVLNLAFFIFNFNFSAENAAQRLTKEIEQLRQGPVLERNEPDY